MNKDIQTKKILIAPLDWGLGHATRCQVLIHQLLACNCKVYIAASSKIKALLQEEFPTLFFLDLRGYKISYSKSKRGLAFKILLQIPKILKIIRFENKWLQQTMAQYNFDAVISDNRYGLYTAKIFSVFITHQLLIKTNIAWFDKILQRLNYNYINRFSECWIPDAEGSLNIAGELSHPVKLPAVPVKYLGPLSRFTKSNAQTTKYKWLVIISGPEPQRSIFENKILPAVQSLRESCFIVRGLPGEVAYDFNIRGCTIINHLNTAAMQQVINESEFIISRCGYTTVMELLSLQKKSILIPTPGQTEQEYLAKHLSEQNWCYSFGQHDDFVTHLQKATSFNYKLPQINTGEYKNIISDFVERIP